MTSVSIALVHYPVLDRTQNVVTTAITNLDLHDMARSARTFGLCNMFVVHPVSAQRDLANHIIEHWTKGSGGRRIPDRVAPMRLVRVVQTLSEACEALGGRKNIQLWTTSAKYPDGKSCSYPCGRKRLQASEKHVLLLFGTGWGLAPELIQSADVCLEPISAIRDTGFNHLSVRAACAITLDRLVGAR